MPPSITVVLMAPDDPAGAAPDSPVLVHIGEGVAQLTPGARTPSPASSAARSVRA